MDTKVCLACGEAKPLDDYWLKEGRRPYPRCKPCHKAKTDEWRRANAERVKEKKREYDRRTATKRNARRRKERAALTDEEKAARRTRQAEASRRMREKRIAEYLDEHGTPPCCACGCGQHVNFNDKGRPNEFLNGHHLPDEAPLRDWMEERYRIPKQRVVDALQKIRKERGWTVQELADRAGVSRTHLQDILYSKEKGKIGMDPVLIENMFRRIQGMPAPASKYQIRRIQRIETFNDRIEKEYGIR
jgi:AraC-like DNA-binding protein